MELSTVTTCTGFHQNLTRSKALSFPLIPSVSTTSSCQRTSLVNEPCNDDSQPATTTRRRPKGGAVDAQRRQSKSYMSRKAAILEVQQSPHLDSALQRSFLFHFSSSSMIRSAVLDLNLVWVFSLVPSLYFLMLLFVFPYEL